MSALLSLYRWRYAAAVTRMLQRNDYCFWAFLKEYWQTQNFDKVPAGELVRTDAARLLLLFLHVGMFLELVFGLIFIGLWKWHDLPGGWQFGLALILAYPIVWAHLLVVPITLKRLSEPKKLGRAIVCNILERQVRRLRARHDFKVVAVIGSIGKTSTKAAIAKTLQASQRVIWQEGNYNDRVTVPLVLFGQGLPGLLNVPAWLKVWSRNARMIRGEYPYDVAVVELGTDHPGEIGKFAYVQPDIVVVSAITPEHMEYFGTLDAVATEELTALNFSKQALINIDDTPAKYLEGKEYLTYGLRKTADYRVSKRKAQGLQGQHVTFHLGKGHEFEATIPMLGEQGAKIAVAATAAASLLGLKPADIETGLQCVTPFAGRMQILPGIKNSTLIDDTYNASPVAVKAALDVLYTDKAPQHIAVLGSMNELGDYSEEAHREVGEHCNPKKLDLVVTIGHDANTWLAPAAEAKGCTVKTFRSPYDAGEFIKSELKDNAAVLAKGSQNGVFAEEALKALLADPDDAHKLVRQSNYWLNVKRKQFGRS